MNALLLIESPRMRRTLEQWRKIRAKVPAQRKGTKYHRRSPGTSAARLDSTTIGEEKSDLKGGAIE